MVLKVQWKFFMHIQDESMLMMSETIVHRVDEMTDRGTVVRL